jgi:hypothetical protein
LRKADRAMADALNRLLGHARDRDAHLAALGDLDDALTSRSQERLREVRA